MQSTGAIVIGGGHNGLICAAYLARAGLDVTVLEARSSVGGNAATQTALDGARFNICNCDHTMIRSTPIIQELGLGDHGLRYVDSHLSQVNVHWDGGPAWYLFHDLERTVELQPHLNDRALGDEVGIGGIADDEVADLLSAQPDAVEVVGRLHPALFQFARDDVGGDRLARRPYDRDRDQHEGQQPEQQPLDAAPDQRGPTDVVHGPFRHILLALDIHIVL